MPQQKGRRIPCLAQANGQGENDRCYRHTDAGGLMADGFDPYHKWLGIPPDQQPADHYRLLGIAAGEDDKQVIESAADRQMAHVRTFQGGPHAAASQRLLNELAGAKICLLNPAKRTAYDAMLQARREAASAPAVAVRPPPVQPAPIGSAPAAWGAVPVMPMAAVPAPLPSYGVDVVTTVDRASSGSATGMDQGRRRRKAPHAAIGVAIGLGLVGVASVVYLASGEHVAESKTRPAARQESPARASTRRAWPPRRDTDPADARQASTTADTTAAEDARPAAPGPSDRIELLTLLDPADAVTGAWRIDRGRLTVDSRTWARIEVPFWPVPARYDLAVAAERQAGSNFLGIGLVCGGRQVLAVLDMNGTCGLDTVDGRGVDDNSTTRVFDPLFRPGQTAAIVCQVREKSIRVNVDGKLVTEWQGEPADLAVQPNWRMPRTDRLFLGAWDATYAIARIDLVPVAPEPGAAVTAAPRPPEQAVEEEVQALAALLRGPDRQAAPEGDALAAARRVVEGMYSEKRKAARDDKQKGDLARQLVETERRNFDTPQEQFALLELAAEVAVEGGSYTLARQALDLLATDYDVDVRERKRAALAEVSRRARLPSEHHNVAESWRQLVKEGFHADDYRAALKAASEALEAARKSKDVLLVKLIAAEQDALAEAQAEWSQVSASRRALDEDPGDRAAGLAWGRYLCAFKNDWERGLPFVARGEGSLAALARRDLAAPPSSARRLHLADEWWTAAEEQQGPLPRRFVRLRAGYWYRQARTGLVGTDRARADERLAAIDESDSDLPRGEWVELLPMVDVAEHTVAGRWGHADAGGVEVGVVDPARFARFLFPVVRTGSYDLEVDFTLATGHEVNVLLPVADREVSIILGGWAGTVAGLHMVDGKMARDNETRRQLKLPIGQRLHLDVGVRVEGDEAAVNASLEGRRLIEWKGRKSALSNSRDWLMPQRGLVGLGAYESKVVFHRVRLRFEEGGAKLLEK
jgi:hypothetical protein